MGIRKIYNQCKLLLTLFFLLVCGLTFGQVGIYETYEDFLNNKLVEYPEHLYTSNFLGVFKVVFADENGKKLKIKLDHEHMWGFKRKDGSIARVCKENQPQVLVVEGKICVYGNSTTRFTDDGVRITYNQFFPHFSEGINGELMPLTRHSYKKYFKDYPEIANKRIHGNEDLFEGIVEYNSKWE